MCVIMSYPAERRPVGRKGGDIVLSAIKWAETILERK